MLSNKYWFVIDLLFQSESSVSVKNLWYKNNITKKLKKLIILNSTINNIYKIKVFK